MAKLVQNRQFRIYHDFHYHAAFPSVCRAGGDEILVAFRRARDTRWLTAGTALDLDPSLGAVDHLDSRSHITLCRLNSELQPVESPIMLPADGEAGDQDASLLSLRDGRILQLGFLWYPVNPKIAEMLRRANGRVLGSTAGTGVSYLPWGSYGRLSEDHGRNWTERRMFPPVPNADDAVYGIRPLLGGALRGQAVELPDGKLLAASYYRLKARTGHSIGLVHQADGPDVDWRYVCNLQPPAGLAVDILEPALAAWPDGQLMAFCRSGGADDRLVTVMSRDLGASWTGFRLHDVMGHPFHPLVLADGRIFLSYGYRRPPYGIRARIIEAGMKNFGEAPELILRDDGPGPDLGYPWALELEKNRILVVYYFCCNAGIRHIAASDLVLA